MRIERQYRGVPLWVIRNYLTELNGKRTGEHCVSGPGWSATLREGEPVTLGPLRFNTVYVAIEGEASALDRLFAAFDKSMLRPGG
jgi:hypothetical protein